MAFASSPYEVHLTGVAQPRVLLADIGGTWTRLTMGGDMLDTDETVRFQTLPDYEAMVGKIANVGAVLLDGKRAHAVGFGIAGQVDTDGAITKAGQLQDYGYVGRNIVADLSEMIGTDAASVVGVNDMVAAAHAERDMRLRTGELTTQAIYTLSTGFGGARFTPDSIMPDEPGHEFLSAGATCGCGADGCLEAHVSGSGIERKYGIRGEDIPADDWRWAAVTNNLALGVNQMLERYAADGHVPTHLHFFGSVALKGPGVLDGLRNKLPAIRDPKETPRIGTAAFGDNSGLHGAYLAALQTLR